MNPQDQEAKRVWNNGAVPVALRRGGGLPIRLRLPYAPDNWVFLKTRPRTKDPVWNKAKKYWGLPAARFNDLIAMILDRHGSVYIIQPYREKEVCAPACMNAKGFECQCSCMAANHGSKHNAGWFEVSETFAVRYGEKQLACRLLRRSDVSQPLI